MMETLDGVDLIAAERRRQIVDEDYDFAHDDEHENGELALAAATYALPLEVRRRHVWLQPLWKLLYPADWFFKGAVYTQATEVPTDTRIRELVKAGALIAAEIDRLDRRRRQRAAERSG